MSQLIVSDQKKMYLLSKSVNDAGATTQTLTPNGVVGINSEDSDSNSDVLFNIANMTNTNDTVTRGGERETFSAVNEGS